MLYAGDYLSADGVTDDTAAIEAAFQAVPANGGTLYCPPGVYIHTTPLEFRDVLLDMARSVTG